MSANRRKKYRIRKKRMFVFICSVLFLSAALIKGGIVVNAFISDDVLLGSNIEEGIGQGTGNETNTILGLRAMSDEDERIKTILSNVDSYPEQLLDMLAGNVETLDFVLGYPEKKGNIYADTIGGVRQGEIPVLLQWDERFGYGKYGDSIIAINGCAPTALSMVITGLTGDTSITPYVVASYAEENGYYVSGSGSSWGLISDGSRNFGVEAEEIPLSESKIYSSLENGNPIICSMRPGDFTTTGHFIVLTGIENGKIKVNDPNSKARSEKLWDYQTLEHQIKNLWAFHLR